MPPACRQPGDLLYLEGEVRRYGVSDVARMKALEDENRRLKRIVADQVLNIDVLKMVASGKF